MRTVDPSIWAPHQHKPPVSQQFGQARRAGVEGALRRSLRTALREAGRRTSAPGARLWREPHENTLHKWLSRCWLGLLLLLGGAGVGLACYQRGVQPAVEVSLPFQEHSINKIPFPAIAICSYNLLSKSRLEVYAKELISKEPEHRYSLQQIVSYLRALGALVDHTMQTVDINFMEYLRRTDPERGNNVTNLMYSLFKPCSQQLVRCSWRGSSTPCGELFVPRVTQLGFCCVFNSRYTPQDLNNKPQTLSTVGQDAGLSVVVRRDMDDHAYIRKRSLGSEVLIWDGFEYPILEAGPVRSYSAWLNVSTYFVLSVTEQLVGLRVHDLTEDRRGCRMSLFAGIPRTWHASYAWCIALCRRDAVLALCGCVPYYMIPRKRDFVCGLNQLSCLNKYREKLLRLFPPNAVKDLTLTEEISDSLFCTHCKPDCTRIRYRAAVYGSRYRDGRKILTNAFTRNVTLGNTTVIRFFYTNEDQKLFVLGVTERWFEAASVVGGEVSVLLGVSLLAASELIFFLTLRWRRHYLKDRDRENNALGSIA